MPPHGIPGDMPTATAQDNGGGGLVSDVRAQLERLRPVYETGVLRLLLRNHAMTYVALLRACFKPLTAELPKETLEARLAGALEELTREGDWQFKDGETTQDSAHQTLVELTREGEGDYAWLANSFDPASHHYLYRLTARAHRAIDALAQLEDTTRTLSGAQANSIIMEVENARKRLTVDPSERIALLEAEVKEREQEIDRLRNGEAVESLSDKDVEDIIAVVHNTLRGVPVDLHELALEERDNGDMLRRRMQEHAMSVDEILAAYHEQYSRSMRESDNGRRFEDAFQVIVTDEGRRQIDDAMQDIARSPYLHGEPNQLLNQVRAELKRIYEGIEDVRHQVRVSDEAVSRLVRQRSDTRYRRALGTFNRLFAAISRDIKDGETSPSPYSCDVGVATLLPLPTRPARPMAFSTPPALDSLVSDTDDAPGLAEVDLRAMVEAGGPRLRHMLSLIVRDPIMRDGRVDVAASFNQLDASERRESELIGFLGALRVDDTGQFARWRCISANGTTRVWRTRPILADADVLREIIEEGA